MTDVMAWDEALPLIVELPDREGILVPAEAAATAAAAFALFKRYAADVWEWPDPITNSGVDGPHQYVNWPARVVSPDASWVRESAVRFVDQEKGYTAEYAPDPDEHRAYIDRVAVQIAADASEPGGWRRSMFNPENHESRMYWKLRVGYVG